jgi:hypothetical protein
LANNHNGKKKFCILLFVR